MNDLIEKTSFFSKYNIDKEDFEKTTLIWDDLEKIFLDYSKEIPKLEASAIYIFNSLMKTDHVHSVRYRVKEAEHMIEKIIRKRIKDPNQIITIENYKSELTDLIGLRALHLFKEEWSQIHEHIITTWELKERPTAYYREGDSADYKAKFEELGCEMKAHPYGYRSVHYILETKPAKKTYFAEIQVRTIFEEAWSEIDHKIRYPYDQGNVLYGTFLLILNRLAGSADEMGTFIQSLKEEMQNREDNFNNSILEKDQIIHELELKIEALKLRDPSIKSLIERLRDLKNPEYIDSHSNTNILGNLKPIFGPTLDYLYGYTPFDTPNLEDVKKNTNIPKVVKKRSKSQSK